MYRDPCHTAMKAYERLKVVNELMGNKMAPNDRCCGGSGTLATTRPSCPSCLQGLSRFDEDAATGADYIVVEIANRVLGRDWLPRYVDAANHGGIERVLL
jgi:Fe-S oxidoreductase